LSAEDEPSRDDLSHVRDAQDTKNIHDSVGRTRETSSGWVAMRRLKYVTIACVAAATMASVTTASGTVGAQTATSAAASGKKQLYIIGAYETKGDSAQAIPNFDDGAKLAVQDLQAKGWTVKYERVPASGTEPSSQEAAFLAAQAKNPDYWIGLTSSNVFIPVGPKVAATDVPSFALASPTEGIRTGPSGGDNIYLMRPLNEQTYSKLLDYACNVLKLHKIGVNAVQTAFGTTVDNVLRKEAPNYKNCQIVTTQTNSAVETELTQQALAFKNAGVDGIISANFPDPMGVLVNQLQQTGVNVPFLGGASLNIAKDSGAITNTKNLVVVDDCVPDIGKTPAEKKFTKAYEAAYGYPPNYASAQV
jgi:ABC-type branched-subunit amino acid transport system substrate-binding protein